MIEHNVNGIHYISNRWPLDEGKTTVVFIHGAGGSCRFWKAQVEGLTGNVNAVALDLPGHGESAGAGMGSIADYAGSVEEFIDAIHAPFPVPCGLSMGGAITLQMLLGGKKYNAGIVINSGARLKVMPFIFDLIKNDYQGYVNSLTSVGISVKTDPSKLQDVIADTRKCNPDVVYNDFMACNAFDIMGRLHEITAPLLVLTADEDKLSPAKYGKYIAEHITGAGMVNIMEAGHMSPVEKPDQVNRAILEFMDNPGEPV